MDVEVYQNGAVGAEVRQVQALVAVTARGTEGAAVPDAAEVLLIDCSSSMRHPPTKIAAARKAAAAAISVLPDGTRFAVVRGTDHAEGVYPRERRLAVASADTRREATAAVERLTAGGGTAMGTWLARARDLFDTAPAGLNHVLLLTDGRNQSQSREALLRVLDTCEGRFSGDARGIGDGWEPAELTEIVRVLRGGVDSVVRDEDLADDFRALVRAALAKVIPDVRLRIGTMAYSSLRWVKQTVPNEYDLTGRCVPDGDREVVLSTGSWAAAEKREFQLAVDLADGFEPSFDRPRQLAWVEVEGGPQKPVLGRWTHDPVPPTLVHPKLLRSTIRTELGTLLADADEAHAVGDVATALRYWGRVARLATETGDHDVLRRLRGVVVIVDAAAESVRPRPEATRSQLLNLLLSRVTHVDGAVVAVPLGEPRECAKCGAMSLPGARFCEACGHPIGDGAGS
ncbi:VWA domain-containing protein [Amycolatopsis rhabdoformis]|uniref:VWA domain-containing protein n=1 Tax=Amycolatopsis rhabdoformis TaxID=1448059 RepID=A0ABZ1IIQ0_9PSEU|nr:VWA domain-containing protein [Amycolatopsis rhabdoformis]WSE34029.1 VWA domain-containing protein [Amycolatopsis rhabdoformis]